MKKVQAKKLSCFFMSAAVASVVLAGVGYFGLDIWLASTQWLLVAAVLVLFSIYLK